MRARGYILILVCALTLMVGATVVLRAEPRPELSKADLEKQLHTLLQERVTTAERARVAMQAAYEAQTVILTDLVEADNKLLEARLAVATTPAQKLDALEKHLESTRETEQKIKVLFKIGTRGGEVKDYATVQRERQTAEIALIQARLKNMR